MKDWIEVRVRGSVDGHDFDRTMTGDGAMVHVTTEEDEDKIKGEFALAGAWSIARLTSHLSNLAKNIGKEKFAQALMLLMMHDGSGDVEKDVVDEVEAEAAANAAAEKAELAAEELARGAVCENRCVERSGEGLNGVEGDGEEPVTPIE